MTKSKIDPYYRYQHEGQLSKNAERVKRREKERLEKERLKQMNEEAKRRAEANTEYELDDLILDAKKSGDYDLASDLLDRKAEVEAKRESERLWLRHGSDPRDVAMQIMRRVKQKHPEEFEEFRSVYDKLEEEYKS